MDAFDDDEIARAISLSLEEQSRATAKQTISLDISDDDELPVNMTPAASDTTTSTSANPFLSERAQMEKERRERARKYRQAAGLKDDDEGSDGEAAPPKPKPAVSRSAVPTSRPAPAAFADGLFFDGELRPIAVQGAEPRKDRKSIFRLSDALGKKSDVSFAILSSYAADIPWIHSFFDSSVPVIFLGQAEKNGHDTAMRYILPNWIRVTPKLGPFGCFHMKFMLIFYKTGRLRVVVTTANLILYDYRNIENVLWLQDIPPRPNAINHDPKSKSDDFPSVMQLILNYMGVKEAIDITLREHPSLPLKRVEDLRCRWDWSKVKVHLVPSLVGKHEGWPDVIFMGHIRLMKAIRNMGLSRAPGQLTLECLGSSLGKYSSAWLNEFYHSALGQSAGDYLDKAKGTLSKRPLIGQIDIIFPTLATVRASVHGEPGGGTMFCKRLYFDNIKKLGETGKFGMRDSKSKAGSILMHTKMILGMLKDDSQGDDDSDVEILDAEGHKEEKKKAIAWAYVGSHNFTPSAWGNVSGSAFNPVITIKNYELGIVFPIHSQAELEKVSFFERPARKYGDGDVAWIQEESLAFAR